HEEEVRERPEGLGHPDEDLLERAGGGVDHVALGGGAALDDGAGCLGAVAQAEQLVEEGPHEGPADEDAHGSEQLAQEAGVDDVGLEDGTVTAHRAVYNNVVLVGGVDSAHDDAFRMILSGARSRSPLRSVVLRIVREKPVRPFRRVYWLTLHAREAVSLPLDGARWLARHVENHPVDLGNLVGDPGGYSGQ